MKQGLQNNIQNAQLAKLRELNTKLLFLEVAAGNNFQQEEPENPSIKLQIIQLRMEICTLEKELYPDRYPQREFVENAPVSMFFQAEKPHLGFPYFITLFPEKIKKQDLVSLTLRVLCDGTTASKTGFFGCFKNYCDIRGGAQSYINRGTPVGMDDCLRKTEDYTLQLYSGNEQERFCRATRGMYEKEKEMILHFDKQKPDVQELRKWTGEEQILIFEASFDQQDKFSVTPYIGAQQDKKIELGFAKTPHDIFDAFIPYALSQIYPKQEKNGKCLIV